MSLHTYAVTMSVQTPADISQITRDDGAHVPWNDPDFQAWNAAQPVPYTLSAAQQAIQAAKQLSFPQFQTWLNNQYGSAQPSGVARLLYELLQRALREEIV